MQLKLTYDSGHQRRGILTENGGRDELQSLARLGLGKMGQSLETGMDGF